MTSTTLYFANVGGYAINVGDISTVAPFTEANFTTGERKGSKITFMSKATSIFIPDLTPEQFMDRLTEAVNLALPD